MDARRWKRIEQVYLSVVDHPAATRDAILADRCAGDQELRREVESLLEARESAGTFLEGEAPLEALARHAVGGTVGPYHLLAPLGAGAMGDVYCARDARLDREVALKILPGYFTDDPARVSRFRQEARAASGLNHPNIVTIYEIGEAQGTWFIAEELVEGGTLRARLAGGALPLPEAVSLCLQCAVALQAAHQAGILHRDIKPENVMVRPDGVAKIVDFGLARISRPGVERAPDATEAGAVLGTPRYMSPEQARGQVLDARSDIFSLGAVFYEMVMGKPAFPGTAMAEVFGALLHLDPPGRSGTALSPSDPLEAILRKALAKDPEARYQSMDQMAGDLRALSTSAPATPLPPAAVRRPRRYAIAAVALAAAALPLLWYGLARSRESGPEPSLSLTPLTSFAGAKDYPAFSPDGSRIAFSWNGGKPDSPVRHIYVKAVGAGDPVQLSFTAADDTWPAWSPDGRSIAFLRRVSRFERAAYLVPSAGGAERKVADAGDGLSWSPDGHWLALAEPRGASGLGGIFLLSLENGERHELTPPRNSESSPAWSPDGKWIAFLRQNPNPDLFVVSANRGPARANPRQLTFDSKPKLGGLTWTPDSREVVYSTQREFGGEGIWRVPFSGGPARRVSSTLLFAGNPNISRDGKRLAYTESWIDTNIYSATGPGFAGGAPGDFGEQSRLIASSREDHSPSFSPDGQRIVFVSNRSGHSEIWTARADGSAQTQLTRFESFAGTPRWSPDGRWIAFDCILAGNADIYLIAASGGSPRRITSDPGPDTKPSFSSDGAWIYFNSDRSGSPQLWKVSVAGGTPLQVTKDGAREAMPSLDGQTIYYTKHGGGGPVWQVPAGGGQEGPLEAAQGFDQVGRAWGILAEGIYFVSPKEGEQRDFIRFLSFATHGVTTLGPWPLRGSWTGPALALSPDGRTLLTVRVDQQINDLMMIENFR